MRYLIIDDEPIAHEIIKEYCDLLPHMELMKNCYDALEALDYLREHTVDLLFLDLNMPKLKGFEFLKTLSEPPHVIVTTAYQEHALEGYELNITDYLLKPFSFQRFLKAVNKVALSPTARTTSNSLHTSLKNSIFLYSDKKHVHVKLADLLYVEAAGNYAKVVLTGSTIVIREKISDVLELLPSSQFIQVHKSFIISKNHLQTIEGNRIRINDIMIPIGKHYKDNLKTSLKL
ncbi:two component transcriptional regulator, LytTR family [Maribacter sedimenticola]|uniref:Two component transcriptional regulator, LytTR family n=1 Tax=Maribacter sedimenticola TaxID=228956 RepID=A0ABY1SGS4_9FLAO|nr:LytTR family DNA-binding domain-containing protein [Maribacter sedimenticola]SNR47024.1 two component transcriptional regulator, LytTR family [Maribacter sedimenticola]